MPARTVLLVAAVAACGWQAVARPVHVAVDWPTGAPASAPARARIQAVQEANSGAPVEAEAGPDGVVLDLGDGVWQVLASAPGYWSQGAQVVVARQAPAGVRLALWPAASLHGGIVTAGGEPLPHAVEIRLSAIAAPAGEMPGARPPGPPRAELRCRIDQEAWNCLGPAGLFDVQLGVAGYAPRYEWGMSLKAAESTDLGQTVLRRTASVFGRAVRRDGSSPPGPCRATLRADADRRGAPEPGPETASEGDASSSVAVNRRGYFQVVGVPAGKLELAVECEAASGIRELSVQPDSETRIDPPLLLEELTLDIAVAPKADPQGRPWRLTVDATVPRLRRIADNATTSADGRWARGGLTAGNYRVTVNGSDGTPWLQRFFELGAGSGPLALRLGSVEVAGRVVLGTQPVRAQLVFFSDAGGEPTTLASDDHGRFQGLLPVTPEARDARWTVDAHAEHPSINRRLVGVTVPTAGGDGKPWLELALPAIPLRGTVVSEQGEPQRGAHVTFKDAAGTETDTFSDDAGGFEVTELPPGKYTAVAESVEGVSDRTPLEVVQGMESELKLVLNPAMRIHFQVVSNQGPVEDAAVQVWIAPGVPRSVARSDRDGGFEVKLPPGTTEVGITIGAPGYALKLTRLQISSASGESSNANTITLDVSAGRLVLDLQPPTEGAPDSPATPYLVHEGAIEDAGTLAGWGSELAGGSGDGPAVIEAIEPGDYALCLLADPSELAAIWRGSLPSGRCRKGSVDQGRTLTLSAR